MINTEEIQKQLLELIRKEKELREEKEMILYAMSKAGFFASSNCWGCTRVSNCPFYQEFLAKNGNERFGVWSLWDLADKLSDMGAVCSFQEKQEGEGRNEK